jgi:hypothetical protein
MILSPIHLLLAQQSKHGCMKRIFILFLFLHPLSFLQAATSPSAVGVRPSIAELPSNANYIFLPVGNSGQTISLMALSNISIVEFELLKGKKLGFFDRIGFMIGQHKLRNKIEVDGTIKAGLVTAYASKVADDSTGFHAGGFFLGLSLSLAGVLLAYLFEDDKKRRRIKWAWIGAAIITIPVLFLLGVFAAAG